MEYRIKAFCELMEKFKTKYEQVEASLDKVYDAVGDSLVELICENSYFNTLINAIAALISDDEKEQANIFEDLSYLIFECHFELDIYCESVYINNERHPTIFTYEDYYHYLKED